MGLELGSATVVGLLVRRRCTVGPHDTVRAPHGGGLGRRRRLPASIPLALSGSAGRVPDGLLPRGVTQGAERVTNLWVAAWIAALVVWWAGALGWIYWVLLVATAGKG